MSYPVIERFFAKHGLLPAGTERLLGRPSPELIFLARQLQQLPRMLALSRLPAARRRDLQAPMPPHLHGTSGFFIARLKA